MSPIKWVKDNPCTKWIKSHKWISLIVIIALCYGLFSISKNKTPPTIYLKAVVTKGTINKSLTVTGEVLPRSLISINSQTESKIKAIHIKIGDFVHKDQLLIELDSKIQENEFKNAQAKLNLLLKQKKLRTLSHELAKKKLQREQVLYKKQATSLDNLERAKENASLEELALEETNSLVVQAENILDTAKSNLENTQVKSPEDGYVISLPVNIGQAVNPLVLLAQITDLDQVKLRMQISENDIHMMNKGLPLNYHLLYDPTQKYTAKIDEIDPAYTIVSQGNYRKDMDIGHSAIYYYVTSFVDNKDHHLRLGMSTENTILLKEKRDVLLLPLVAIDFENNQSVVKSVDENGNIQSHPVTLGLSDDKNIEITSGIPEGQEVIISSGAKGDFIPINFSEE